ncbi:MAG: primosomal protein N', partial [Burkholderiales bacterium]
MEQNIIRVAIDSPLDFILDYRWIEDATADGPCALPQVGQLALVPFGRREVVGLIVEIAASSDVPPEKLKNALAARTQLPPLADTWLALCRFAADYYQRPLGEVAMPGLPKNLRAIKTTAIDRALKKLGSAASSHDATPAGPPVVLNPAQQQAIDSISAARGYTPILLY